MFTRYCRLASLDSALSTNTPPNDVYDELRHAGFSGCSEEDQEETFNRFLKPAAPPDSGNGVVVPHEAPDGLPKPKKKGKK